MDISVKVILEEKEYQRLLDIETKYKELLSKQAQAHGNQGGDGNLCRCHTESDTPLTQIIAENKEAHALKSPVAGILPSITAPDESRENELNVRKASASTPEPVENLSAKARTSQKDNASNDDVGYHEFVLPWYYIGIPGR